MSGEPGRNSGYRFLPLFFRPPGFRWRLTASRPCFAFARFAARDSVAPRVRSMIDSASLITASDTCRPAGSAGSSPRFLCPARSQDQQVHAAGCTSRFKWCRSRKVKSPQSQHDFARRRALCRRSSLNCKRSPTTGARMWSGTDVPAPVCRPAQLHKVAICLSFASGRDHARDVQVTIGVPVEGT